MAAHSSEQDFVLTVVDVVMLGDRGTVVMGPVESGVLETGEEVEVWDGQHQVARARATFELISTRRADPDSIALRLRGVERRLLRPGQVIRRTAGTTNPRGLTSGPPMSPNF